ncbi:MAG: hypothetical protein RR712_03395 [Terrisporobacter sp.]
MKNKNLGLLVNTDNKNITNTKKFYKKWWFWVVAIIVIVALSSGGKEESDIANNNIEPIKETQKEEPKDDVIKFDNAELNIDNINEVAKSILTDKLISADLSVENDKNIVDIVYNPGAVFDDKALVKNNAVTATKIMKVLFSNPAVDKVWVWTQTEMTDAKGNKSLDNVVNVCLTKENAAEINWSNFNDMVITDYNALYKIADSNFIHPAIAKNIK